MKLPRVAHKKVKKLGDNFYRATDRRSEKEATLEIPVKCGYEYYLHETPSTRNYRKNKNKRERGSTLIAPSTRTDKG